MILDNLDRLAESVDRCVVLYSGGIDSSFFLLEAQRRGLAAQPLFVHLGPGEEPARVAEQAAALGCELVTRELTEEFAERYVSKAILANAFYQQQYPISSSLSRPLMAQQAVNLAHERGISCVAHTATGRQNSSVRFHRAFSSLDPNLVIGCPFFENTASREQKLAALLEAGLAMQHGIYSVDENLWARVVENGELDDPAVPVPEHVFLRTAPSEKVDLPPLRLALKFRDGLPVSLDGTELSLKDLIARLQDLAGSYGIGRYNGLESSCFGFKNHEVREAPAASVLLTAHQALENAVFSARARRYKSWVDYCWTELAVDGNWFSPLAQALFAMIERLSREVHGIVSLTLKPGQALVTSIDSDRSPSYWNARNLLPELLDSFPYAKYLELESAAQGVASLRKELKTKP